LVSPVIVQVVFETPLVLPSTEQDLPEGEATAVYLVIGDPLIPVPVSARHLTTSFWSSESTAEIVGADGKPLGVIFAVICAEAPSPARFTAKTLIVYAVPFVSPVTEQLRVVAGVSQENEPGDKSTT
jgi:hypothetical protein